MKRISTWGLAIGILLGSFLSVSAQITQGGTPRSFLKLVPSTTIPKIQLGGIDEEKLRQEDAQRAAIAKELDRRFGYTFDVQFDLNNSGIWTELPNGDRIWRLTISSTGARSINLTFSKYRMPYGADIFLIGEKNRIGALTSFNQQTDGKLGTGLIGGEYVTLEYFEPASVRGQGLLEVGKATHGYKDPFSTLGWGESDDCEMNVNCPLGAPWKNEKRSVARIVDNGDVCTGALVNNILQDGKPYFLTANHCYSASSTTWVFSFNWEAPACITPTQEIPENQTISGSTLKARNGKSDFCLFELSSKPPSSFKAYYSGWSAVNTPSTSSTIIHHPAGDIKKISFDTDPANSTGYGVGSTNDNSHWEIGNYEFATTTEGGSSGSPMFDQNHRIVGQLHGGPAGCTNIAQDYYGKVSMSWAEGTTPATRLKDWLDPNNSGLMVMDGLDPACFRVDPFLPYQPKIDTVVNPLPFLWKAKNPDADSTFRLVTGGFNNLSGKAIRMIAENFDPEGRGDSLILAPVTVSRYKKLKFNFRYAYRRKATTLSDTVSLLVSQNCGSTFKKLAQWSGSQFVTDNTFGPGPFEAADTLLWRSVQTDLDSSYNRAEQLVFAFGFKSGNAGTLWLDEFRISGDTAKDKPFVRFEANKLTGCVGLEVQFSDSSANNPTAWAWTFEGGTPATSTVKNPVVTYSTLGTYKVTLVATNEEGSDTLVNNDFIQVFELGNTSTPYFENFAAIGSFPPVGYLLLNPENNVSWTNNVTINAPGSQGGSLMFDNYTNPNVTGNRDLLVLPKISTTGKSHLKMRLQMAYKAYTQFGQTSPDTLTIGYTRGCGGQFFPLWKRGGTQLATAGAQTNIYTPAAADWAPAQLDLDSLLAYPEVAIGFENLFGFGNRLFIDDIRIDTLINCPFAPVISVNTDSVCIGNQLIISMDSLSGATYSWTGPGTFTATTRTVIRNITTTTQAGTYKGTVTQDNCNSPATSLLVSVFNNPVTPIFSQNGNQLTGPNGMANYVWIVNGTDTLNVHTRVITAPYSGSYVLVVFNAGKCPKASLPVNVVVTSIRGMEESVDMKAIPNPTSGSILLQTEDPSITRILGIFNSMGQNMTDKFSIIKQSNGLKVEMQTLPLGCYWFKVSVNGRIQTIPVIKN